MSDDALAVVVLAVAVGGIFLLMRPSRTQGTVPEFTEGAPYFGAPPGAPVVGPDQHVGGVVYTPHRYPSSTAPEITAVMHGGWTAAGLPAGRSMLWLSNPPAEATL